MQEKLKKLEKSFNYLYLAVDKIISGNEIQGALNSHIYTTYKELKKTLGNCYILLNNIEERLYKIEKELNLRDI